MSQHPLACLILGIACTLASSLRAQEKELTSLIQIDATFKKRKHRSKWPGLWPSARGRRGHYSWSPFPGPDITQPNWTWHDPNGKWATIGVGTSIDSEKSIYLTAENAIRKFSPDGQLLWSYAPRSIPTDVPLNTNCTICFGECTVYAGEWSNQQYCQPAHALPDSMETGMFVQHEIFTKAAALMGGAVYGVTTAGRAFSLNQDTGEELWSTSVSINGSDANFGQVMAYDGVVVAAVDHSDRISRPTPLMTGDVNHKVVGLDGTDGKILWEYEPDRPVWNFGTAFADDGTFIYQDLEGYVYRHSANDGNLIWKANTGVPESWTDGQANLGANGIVYSVANFGQALPGTTGLITATNLSTGQLIWKTNLPSSPNSIPAVGWLVGQPEDQLSVVIPIGQNDMAGFRIEVYALDAKAGNVQWIFKGPTQKHNFGEGDEKEHWQARLENHEYPQTLPNSWGTPVIDARGVVYVGCTTGQLFALRDTNGDGEVSGPDDVSFLSTDAAFVGSSAPAFAPGLLAITNGNSLIVYQYPEATVYKYDDSEWS